MIKLLDYYLIIFDVAAAKPRPHQMIFVWEVYDFERFLYSKIDVFLEICFIKIIYKPYHENRNKIPDRSVVLMSEIDMKSLKL